MHFVNMLTLYLSIQKRLFILPSNEVIVEETNGETVDENDKVEECIDEKWLEAEW